MKTECLVAVYALKAKEVGIWSCLEERRLSTTPVVPTVEEDVPHVGHFFTE